MIDHRRQAPLTCPFGEARTSKAGKKGKASVRPHNAKRHKCKTRDGIDDPNLKQSLGVVDNIE